MTLVAGGDSIIWGSELADCPHGGINGYSRSTFSALLSDDYRCVAYPGISNKDIVVKVKNAIDTIKNTLVLVCWTWPTRDNKLDSDDEILDLQIYLEQLDIPYLFTCVDNCVVTNNPKIKWNNWYFFPAGLGQNQTETSRGFYQWAIENKYSMGLDGHPLEQAHQDAAILIKEKFNELVKKSI
jgi:hypothetical protein